MDTYDEETEMMEICEHCSGNGGFDASRDCEEYDDWQECPYCEGYGQVRRD